MSTRKKTTSGSTNTAQVAVEPIKRTLSDDTLEMSRRITNVWKANKSGLGLTQQKAADQIGVTQPMFSQMLNGAVSINPMMALSVAALLRCDIGVLCEGLEEYKLLLAMRPVTGSEIPVTLTLTGNNVTGKFINVMTAPTAGAFAVEIDTHEYAPRYKNGEYAIVDPLAQWVTGDEVLVRYGTGACIIRVVGNKEDDIVQTHHPVTPGIADTVDLTDPKITVRGVILGVKF